jgi:hypothetical protein
MRYLFSCLLALALPLAAQTVRASSRTVAEQYLFAALNQERAAIGLPALVWNPELAAAARKHAARMANANAISHQFAGEPDLTQRASATGARFSTVAENVAVAPTSPIMHDAWMHSKAHRDNILATSVTSVGIAIVPVNGSLWAVEDFARDVANLSLDQQEQQVASLLSMGNKLRSIEPTEDARRTCSLSTGFAGERQPWFVMRYTAGDLTRLPDELRTHINSGKFTQATVGACTPRSSAFTSYSIAVLLYP